MTNINTTGLIEFRNFLNDYNLKDGQKIDNDFAMGTILDRVPKGLCIALFQDAGNTEFSGIKKLLGTDNQFYTLFNNSSWAAGELEKIIVVDENKDYLKSLICITKKPFINHQGSKYDYSITDDEIRSIDNGLGFLIAPKASYFNMIDFEPKLKSYIYNKNI